MSFEIPKRSVLYYPYMNIAEPIWLRQSLLYWDEIGSIVPRDPDGNAALEFSVEQEYLMSLGVYQPCYPEDTLLNHGFINLLENELREIIQNLFAQGLEESWHGQDWIPTGRNKITDSTYAYFHSIRAIKKAGRNYKIRKTPFLIYMSLLAKYVALDADQVTTASTDEPEYQEVLYKALTEEDSTPAFDLTLQKVLPAPKENVPFESILKFKDNHNRDLQKIWKLLGGFQKQVTQCESQSDIKEAIISFDDDIKGEMSDLYDALSTNNIEFGLGLTTSLVPLVSDEMAKATGSSQDGFGVSLAVSIGTVGISYCATRVIQRHKILRDSPVAYLYRIENELTL